MSVSLLSRDTGEILPFATLQSRDPGDVSSETQSQPLPRKYTCGERKRKAAAAIRVKRVIQGSRMLGNAHTPSQWRESVENLSQQTEELCLVDPTKPNSPQAASHSALSTTQASAHSGGAASALEEGVYTPDESTRATQQSEIPGSSLHCIPDSQVPEPSIQESWFSDIEELTPTQKIPCTYEDELDDPEDQQDTDGERCEDLIDSQAYSSPEDICDDESQDSDQSGTSDAGRPTGDDTGVPKLVDPHDLRARFSYIGREYRKNYRKYAKKVVRKWKCPGAYARLMTFLNGGNAKRKKISVSQHPRGTAFHSTPQASRGPARSAHMQRRQKQPSPSPKGLVDTTDSMDLIDLSSSAGESSQRSRSSSSASSWVSLPSSMMDSRECDTTSPAPPSTSKTETYLDGSISDSQMEEAYEHALAEPGTPPSAQRPRR
ncbi:hypothetical protein FB567DRAFT_555822 [Paraphoma chrysanthemicola]|uniref:Uncharacterized protein n=1 Tax=Paraphoma chrysanthemicola TaxID=798071 RepID=A0A8K0QT19_9PLEO|nr:hypothetical protein FB567DRAFT_555822 [Paraphoma chrysanthemicola]